MHLRGIRILLGRGHVAGAVRSHAGVAIAVAMQHHLPITYVGLGEKMEDLRPFSGEDYARALLGVKEDA